MLLSCRAIYLLKGKMEIYDDSMERRGDDILYDEFSNRSLPIIYINIYVYIYIAIVSRL